MKLDPLLYSKIRTYEEFKEYRSNYKLHRSLVESRIVNEHKNDKKWHQIGFCELCERDTLFELDWTLSKNGNLNFRGILTCQYCKLPNRKRFMLSYLKKILTRYSYANVFMYESVTKLFKYAQSNFHNANIIGSEFFGYDKKSGELIDGIRHEDALNLSLFDESVDIIVSNDVFEHIPNYKKGLSEAYRVLKQNGLLLISIPFLVDNMKTKQRAILKNNQIEHILPPEYHSNPISNDGSLVFFDYGWDFLKFLKNSGFHDVYMLSYYDMFYGYIGNGMQFIFVAEK